MFNYELASSNGKRYYYAVHHSYGIQFSNDVFHLYRFPSCKQRDEFVAAEDWDGNYCLESVPRDVARQYFPQAFGDKAVIVDSAGDEQEDWYVACNLESEGLFPWVRHEDGSQSFGMLF